MFLSSMRQEEIPDVKSFIGPFDKCKWVQDVKLGSDNPGERELHDWGYIGIRFISDVSHCEIIAYLVKCGADEFYGINNNYYVLKFE